MSSYFIYLRIFGYVVTIVMHAVNTVSMATHLQQEDVVELFKEPTVRFFNENQARYFTCWTFFLQWVYAWIGLVCDCLTLKNSHKEGYQLNIHLRRSRDTLLSAIVWPSTFLVATLFWSLYHYDRELIFPSILDKALTTLSNHIIHTAIVPLVVWEVIFRPRTEPKTHTVNLRHIAFHFALYFSVVIYTYFEKEDWIYPILKQMWGTLLFPLFLVAIMTFVLLVYFAQWPLNRLLHGNVTKYKKKVC